MLSCTLLIMLSFISFSIHHLYYNCFHPDAGVELQAAAAALALVVSEGQGQGGKVDKRMFNKGQPKRKSYE